ncbi:MAG TPA: SCP2 sterol-binding domain-containing protein, partial [Ktedonobacteraceae bacterium]|nr:SCP2 sterol-binding domain-containing protein [Ktedonobacteraceae bacterium]
TQNAFTSSQERTKLDLIDDLSLLVKLLIAFFERVEPDAWFKRRRPERTGDWTLHETVAHLVSAAEFYCSALQHTLRNEPVLTSAFQQRQDLPAYNQQAILQRKDLQPSQLLTALEEALSHTCALARQITPEQLQWQVAVPVFNRQPTILEVLEAQATHPGMVHAAQIAAPAHLPPLWHEFDEGLLNRMLTRFFHLMALVYWPERGGKISATLQFVVAGPAGGTWHVDISPTGCQADEGASAERRITTIRAASADALCQIFTQEMGLGHALLTRKMTVKGNLILASRLLFLFSPT